jgi:hypothetical protein
VLGVKKRIYVPACHQPVLRGDGDNSGHLFLALAVGHHPGDRFGMIPSYIFDGHCVFSIQIFAVKYFEWTVIEWYTYFAFRVYADLDQQNDTFLIFFCSISF